MGCIVDKCCDCEHHGNKDMCKRPVESMYGHVYLNNRPCMEERLDYDGCYFRARYFEAKTSFFRRIFNYLKG